jgi:hypothetical protein
MKLAEALLLRSEYQKKIENLQHRIMVNLKVQENDNPYEDPAELIKESFSLNEQLCALVKQINARNNTVTLPGGQILAEALADRDALMKKRNLLAAVTASAVEKDYRMTHAEIKMCVTLPIGELQKQIDSLSRSFRELDAQIQAVNWTAELEE